MIIVFIEGINQISSLQNVFSDFFFLFLFPIRGTRFVDIFLSDVTMNLHRGQGVSASLSLYLPIFLKIIIFCKWTCSDNLGDRPRPLPFIKEIENAIDITERRGTPSWDYDVSLCSFTLYNPRHILIELLVPVLFCQPIHLHW